MTATSWVFLQLVLLSRQSIYFFFLSTESENLLFSGQSPNSQLVSNEIFFPVINSGISTDICKVFVAPRDFSLGRDLWPLCLAQDTDKTPGSGFFSPQYN